MDKQKLREEILGQTACIKDRGKKDGIIREKTLANPKTESAERICAHISFDNEVDTKKIVEALLDMGKKVYAPRVKGVKLTLHEVNSLEELKPGYMGILEPDEKAVETSPEKIQLILVPAVAFTPDGKRLGRGGGHYDRLLPKTNAYKIGLAYREQIISELPIQEHDIPVDEVITD